MEKCARTDSMDAKLQEIVGLKTQFDVFRFMRRLTEEYGAKVFMVVNLPPLTSLTLSSNTVITNLPAELIAAFDRESLLASSPVLKRLRESAVPFALDMSTVSKERGSSASEEMFGRYGLSKGAHFPVHDGTGLRGSIALIGDRTVFDIQQMMELSYLFIHVYEALGQIRSLTMRAADTLSDREVDCLNWTAAGKTSAEIAEILGLSEHTVNHYLNRAAKKLDTVNRTQAVAKALRTGLIK
ncbi:MAG: LuxR family transcriptional regulator [Alphaproteobacteria bacterium]|uniref:LuxR family transcriptional regulator n=2 Tax=Rhizobium/Agrobacterium group TaxID=227290 RepID=A0A922P1V6_9HYPH|nr:MULTISPECIES: LuxR family transcriptional regulator [Pseudorhizobium]MBU1314175.1 LuxR family transcriptional regulator [Alphaproteobacteria bacterium]MDY6960485.1 LuxR C-terminal-related transcriptional regulator [Pseudomonadota bacterium]KEQ09267.1 LuxR family transcriptional regulator [Pseudorhizobium pelagicum]KEQ10913.1 LuxR family transcriptional regulator [Pseudorhizobium pelagicum]MBU1552527.1 LuxR family transcriptional regulator [Alphaproteobacteria bacterium]